MIIEKQNIDGLWTSQYEVVLFRNKLKSLEDLIQSVDLCCIDKL